MDAPLTRSSSSSPGQASRLGTAAAALILVLAGVHVVATRLSWSDARMQTDAGIWAYIGGRILDGAVLYRDLWESKPPGIYYTFAAMESLFGVGSDRALLWMDAVLSAAVLWLTYVAARRFASRVPAAAAVAMLGIIFCHRGLADWGDNVEKFVALFEMLAFVLLSRRLVGRGPGAAGDGPAVDRRLLPWILAGACCGGASLFKQTGIVFLMAILPLVAMHVVAGEHVRRRASLRRAAALVGGFAAVWLPVILLMSTAGMLAPFVKQVLLYDLARVGSSEWERSRLADPEHWSTVIGLLWLAGILMGPAAVAAIYRIRRGLARGADQSSAGPRQERLARRGQERTASEPVAAGAAENGVPRGACPRSPRTAGEASQASDGLSGRLPGVVLPWWALAMAVVVAAPYGYGHYLLQAAPPATLLVAWFFDQTLRLRGERAWATVAMVTAVLSLSPLRDHFLFTFDANYEFRQAYRILGGRLDGIVEAIQSQTTPDQSVMVWPSDDAISYYAGRRTPLECSNSDVIFKDKIARLDPPMETLLARLQADPPDVIVDWTPVDVEKPDASDPTGEPHLLTPAGGFSLAEDADDAHPMLEGRTLAPLKRWVRANYGGQRRVGLCTFYDRGLPWRSWQEVLLP